MQTPFATCCPQERFRGYGVVKADATWQDAFLLTKLAPQLVLARQASCTTLLCRDINATLSHPTQTAHLHSLLSIYCSCSNCLAGHLPSTHVRMIHCGSASGCHNIRMVCGWPTCRFMELRAAVPAGELPVYAPREQMRGADVRCYVQASVPRNSLSSCCSSAFVSLLLYPSPFC